MDPASSQADVAKLKPAYNLRRPGNGNGIYSRIYIGLDLAKTVFQVHGVDERGRIVLCKTLRVVPHRVV